MNKFFVLSFGIFLSLTGCKDSEKKSFKNQSSHIDPKALMNVAKSWSITTVKTLGMTLDSTTKAQAIDILKSQGYVLELLEPDITKEAKSEDVLKEILSGFTQSELKSIQDKLRKSTVVCTMNSNLFQNKPRKLQIPIDPTKEHMIFIFDENEKLIIFFKQYSENKEAGLVIYEAESGSLLSKQLRSEIATFVCRKDFSMAIIGIKDPGATWYCDISSSIAKERVITLMKSVASTAKSSN